MQRHPSPYLASLDPEPDRVEFGKRLEEFRLRHELSIRSMASICGGDKITLHKSTLYHLIRATGSRKLAHKLQPLVAASLRNFLSQKELTSAQIEAELKGIADINIPLFYGSESVKLAEGKTWGERLEAFRLSMNLSYRQLWFACGGKDVITQNTIMHVCKQGRIYKEEYVKSRLSEHLRNFLMRLGKQPQQIEQLLTTIFNGEDTMIAPRASLPIETQQFFGLRRDPFTGDPRSRSEVFTTPQLDRVAAQIEDAINYQGFTVVTGEIGSGKTILKRRIVDHVTNSNGKLKLFWPEFFNMDRVHSGSIVSFLLSSFEQTIPSDLVARAAKLKRILANASENGVRVALGFDECHHLHDRLLTALKNFWEMGNGGYDRYLGVVLFGQPQFEGRLQDFQFREICERIDVVRMPSFEKSAADYIAHRIKLAGGDAERIFDRSAIKLLSKQATTPLAIGNLANAALLKAHTLGERKVLADFLKTDDDEPRVRAVRRVAS